MFDAGIMESYHYIRPSATNDDWFIMTAMTTWDQDAYKARVQPKKSIHDYIALGEYYNKIMKWQISILEKIIEKIRKSIEDNNKLLEAINNNEYCLKGEEYD